MLMKMALAASSALLLLLAPISTATAQLLQPPAALPALPAFEIILALPLNNLDALEALFWRVA